MRGVVGEEGVPWSQVKATRAEGTIRAFQFLFLFPVRGRVVFQEKKKNPKMTFPHSAKLVLWDDFSTQR